MVVEIKFIKGKNFFKNWQTKNQKVGFKNLEIYIKNREKNLQFFGVNESKIQWMDLKIKLMKHKKFFLIGKCKIKKVSIKKLKKS